MLIWVLVILAGYLFYKWGTSTYDYFEKRGVPFNKPLFLVGSRLGMLLRTQTMIEFLDDIYNEFKNEKVSGMFEFRYPAYFIRDPEILKRLAVKEFDSFTDRRIVLSEDIEPLFAKAIFGLQGQKWRDMRATLSPAFTGSKMRLMFKLMNQVGSQMSNTIKDQINNGAKNHFEFKDFAKKFTVDIIATCAFGIEVNSFKDPTNEFINVASKATNFGDLKTSIKMIGFLLSPKLMHILKVKIFDNETTVFFENAISETMKAREHQGITRNDMIDLLLQVKKGGLTHEAKHEENNSSDGFATVEESDLGKTKVKRTWDDSYLTAQCFIFFFAGFETVSTVMTFMAYELIVNPEIQRKLQEEIDEMNQNLNGKSITYEEIQKMKYMDMVVCETLRKWPPAPIMDRICTKDYTLEYDDKKINFEVGRNFFIPIYSIHHEPKYFPNPNKFDPERFSDENKGSINQDAYMPFGIGPRNCIGSRFALLEVKTIFYYLLLNFNFEATKETQIPMKLIKSQVAFQLEKGLQLALVPRSG